MTRAAFNSVVTKALCSAVALAAVQTLTTKKLLKTVALTVMMMVGVLHPRLSYSASDPGFYYFLVRRSIVTPEQFSAATDDNARNAVIATLNKETGIDGSRLQSMSNQDLNNFISDWYTARPGFYKFLVQRSVVTPEQFNVATYDNIRNTVIATLNNDTRVDVSTLQGMSNQDLNKTISDQDSNSNRHSVFYNFLVNSKRLVTLEKFNTMRDDEIRNAVIATVYQDTRIDGRTLQSMTNQKLNNFIVDWYYKAKPGFEKFLRSKGTTPDQFNAWTYDQIRNTVIAALYDETGLDAPTLQGMSNEELNVIISEKDDPNVPYRMSGSIKPSLTVVGRGGKELLEKIIDQQCNSVEECKSPLTFDCPGYHDGNGYLSWVEEDKNRCTITFESSLGGHANISKTLRDALKKEIEKHRQVTSTFHKGLCSGAAFGPCEHGPISTKTNWGIPSHIRLTLHQKGKKGDGVIAWLGYTISSQSSAQAGCPGGSKSFADYLKLLNKMPGAGDVLNLLGGVITFECDAAAGA